jgi:hypothetical protein
VQIDNAFDPKQKKQIYIDFNYSYFQLVIYDLQFVGVNDAFCILLRTWIEIYFEKMKKFEF